MLLSSVGESISPNEIEAYTAVGLGAFWLPQEKLLFYSSRANPPDIGISRALRLLGFDFKESAEKTSGKPPYDQLKSDLRTSPAILGPLDMGYMIHNPVHKRMAGADHYALAYAMNEDVVEMHDPEGFPSVHLSFAQLEPAWRAERVGYRRGYYRYWTNPRRTRHIDANSLHDSALRAFRGVYLESEKLASKHDWTIDSDAILTLAKRVRTGKVKAGERAFMIYFSLKLGARRALDFAKFFSGREPNLASEKIRQAELFGKCQSNAVQRRWANVAELLTELAGSERRFRAYLMAE